MRKQWGRWSRSNILMKLWQFACSRQALFGESQKTLSVSTNFFFMAHLNEATFKSGSRFWLEALTSWALECLKKHWTTKSEKVCGVCFFYYYYYYCVPVYVCCCELLTYYVFLSSSSKGREEGCKRQVGNLPIRQLLKYEMIWGPSSYSGCSFFQEQCFNSNFYY